MILTARGAEQQQKGVDNILALINLALASGRAGKRYSGFGCLTGQGNGQGGREHGQKANQLPGYRKIDDPEEVFDELRRASAGGAADYAAITYGKIESNYGVFWPCPEDDHPGTPRLFESRFATPDGKARFHAVEYRPPAEEPDEAYPLYLTTGRVLAQYPTGTQTRRIERLGEGAPEPVAEIHPTTARRYALTGGDDVVLTTRRGSAHFRVKLTPTVRADTVFVPFHWGGERAANLLTNPALDPVSRMPEFKVCAARIEAPATRRSDL